MGEHRIALVRRGPSPKLAGLVAGIVGMSEHAPGTVRRRQSAGSLLPLVLSFGAPLTIESLSDAVGAGSSPRSFLAGFSTGHATTRFTGLQECVQVYLHPLGVRRLLGVPGREVARRVVDAESLLPRMGRLVEHLADTDSWPTRLALVEAALEHALADDDAAPAWVRWMWHRICATGGQVRIGTLAERTGWSHRYVTTVFTEHVGLSPKQAAGVVRFERAMADLGRLPLADLAPRHGYADQSHLTRAVARHAGESPTRLGAARRPTAWTALGRDPTGAPVEPVPPARPGS